VRIQFYSGPRIDYTGQVYSVISDIFESYSKIDRNYKRNAGIICASNSLIYIDFYAHIYECSMCLSYRRGQDFKIILARYLAVMRMLGDNVS
jgi:hypothetical protein